MASKKELLGRIADIKVGDVLRAAGCGRIVVTKINDNGSIHVHQWTARGWSDGAYYGLFSGPLELTGRGFRLVDVGKNDQFFWVGEGPTSGRPYVMWKKAAGVMLRAGCRRFTTYAQAARHWSDKREAKGYCDAAGAKRHIAKEAFAEARRLGWLNVKRQPPVKKARAKK